jgi:cytochrome b
MSLLAIDGEGPLAGTFFASLPEDPIEELHELFANGTLLLIFLHVAGVIYSSYEHKENLVRSMIHGRKQALPDDK